MPSLYAHLIDALGRDQAIALATIVAGAGMGQKMLIWPDGHCEGSLGAAQLDQETAARALVLLEEQQAARFVLEGAGVAAEPVDIFVDVYVPPPKLIIVGAVHIAIPLVTFAKTLGFYTVVVDARAAFATQERFGHADELIVGWPEDVLAELDLNESTYIVTLTHDEKLDNPALLVALSRPVRYIGALGSSRTHAKRVEMLKASGVSSEQIARIHAPIGLDLGGRKPEEIAVAITAEIVTVMNGKDAG